MKRTPLRRTQGLKRSAVKLARTALRTDPTYRMPQRSKKAKETDPLRAVCRSLVILRDLGEPISRPCVFHRILAAQGRPEPCPASDGVEVHEVVTRARGGSPFDPKNCLALCHPAHAWVTAHPAGAEALGLMMPSWADQMALDSATWRREVYAVSSQVYSTPWWRSEDRSFRVSAISNLVTLGIIRRSR